MTTALSSRSDGFVHNQIKMSQAEWPDSLKPTVFSSSYQIAKNILSFVLFPVGVVNFVIRANVHPASVFDNNIDNVAREKIRQIGGKIVQFKTPDGEIIEGAYFKGSSSSKKGIVYAPGNNAGFDATAPDFVNFVRKNVGNIDVLAIGYRGVGNSTGTSSPQGLALDTYSAGEYLHKQIGIQPSKILFYGHSLGGYASAKGAALFQEKHSDAKISVVSDRSFSDLIDATHKIAGLFIASLLYLWRWQLDAKAEWNELKGRKIVIYDKKDPIIPFAASFFEEIRRYNAYYHLPALNKQDTIELDSKEANSDNPHCRAFTSDEARKIGRQIRRAIS